MADELATTLRGKTARPVTQIMDFSGRTPMDSGVHVASDDAILVADGGFLQKPALSRHWDLRIYLHIEVADVQYRGTVRDQAWMDPAEAAAERYRTYYLPGEKLHLAEVRPAGRADIVIDNRNFEAPRIMRDLPDRGCQGSAIGWHRGVTRHPRA